MALPLRAPSLRSPYERSLAARIHEATFQKLVGLPLVAKARIIKDLGNKAAHEAKAVPPADAITAVRELFHVSYWLVRTYANGAKPDPAIGFSPQALPRNAAVSAKTLAQLQEAARRFADAAKGRDEAEAQRLASETERAKLEAEIAALRAEVAQAKAANAVLPDAHDYDEATTRDAFIDILLAEAGWSFTRPGHDTEFAVAGMPNTSGEGFVDYVLWGDDGKPLGLVEAKRTQRDARVGQQQAKLYADCLEKQFGQRPVIFYTNGYDHWIWDDRRYPPRPIQGFLTKDELELAIRRRATLKPLNSADIESRHRGALLSIARDPPRRRDLREGPHAPGAARHGDRGRQDPHRDRAERSSDARQLGAAGAVPRRPGGWSIRRSTPSRNSCPTLRR